LDPIDGFICEGILWDLKQILGKILLSQVCLCDLIHDGEKIKDPKLKFYKAKYKFWERAEKITRDAINRIEEEYKKVESKEGKGRDR